MAFDSNFSALRLDDVGRDFGNLHALNNLSLTVQRGEFIALLGPSGCGKSTALNCIAGLLPTTRGSIWIDDTRIDTLPTESRGFGMVFQNYALFPHMSVADNVAFGLRMRGAPKADIAARVAEALKTVRLENQSPKLPGQLSGGQQQRVAIARAIAIRPPLVLMDEPLSNLDAKLRLEMRQEIRRIHQGLGSITIYVTHDQDEALSLADRIVVMRDGRIRQVGTPEDLYMRPATQDVAEFMGFRNQLKGKVRSPDSIEACGAVLSGTAAAPLGQNGIVAMRPDDLVAGAPGTDGIPAIVEAIEYRGRDFFGAARTSDGTELFFRAPLRVALGETVHLHGNAAHTVLFPAEA